MSTYKLGFHWYKPLVWCGHKHTVNAFFSAKTLLFGHKSRVFCNNTLMSAIIQETGGPLREERAVDGKLKSRLEWPYVDTDSVNMISIYTAQVTLFVSDATLHRTL